MEKQSITSQYGSRVNPSFEINGYGAVIPHIQNYYPVERCSVGWQFGFKYQSGVFEFFQYKTRTKAIWERKRLIKAIEDYYLRKEGGR